MRVIKSKLTVLFWSKLNKDGGLRSEPFMKGTVLLDNFRRDLAEYKIFYCNLRYNLVYLLLAV